MDNIQKAFEASKSPSDFAKKYFKYHSVVLESISLQSIDKLVKIFEESRNKGNTIFVIGNGGSSATASTMANDIGFDILKKTGISKAFKIHSLTDNSTVLTAIANDVGYENIFINQLKIHYKSGDKLIVITASGNSENLIRASEWVKSKKGKVVGFLGFDGGKMKSSCDHIIQINTKKNEYGIVEDCHLIINHILAHWFQNKLK